MNDTSNKKIKILMRGGKDPFKVATAEETLDKNILGTNIGNAMFQVASHKLLITKNSEVVMYKFTPSLKDIEWVNKEFDYFVIPLANAFRPSFKKNLDKHTEFIKKLKIPVVILGVGVQANLDCNDFSHLKGIKESVIAFCDAVLQKSPSIGVRGECTYKYLMSLGYAKEQIKIIGCPSMFWHGKNIYVNKKIPQLYKNSKIAFNLSPYASGSEKLLQKVESFSNNITYIPQNNDDLRELLYGIPRGTTGTDKLITNLFYKKNKALFFIEPRIWIEFLQTCNFAIGTRIHGTIANLIAGTPAHIIVHDSRTRELAEYFDIPYTLITEVDDIDIKTLYEKSSYTNMINNHHKRFDNMLSFLNEHSLDNIFSDGNELVLKDYNNLYHNNTYEEGVKYLKFESNVTLMNRLKYVYKEKELCKLKK